MTHINRTCWAVALLASMFALSTAGNARAVKLMVNGDTPARAFQRAIDRSLMPTPDLTVTLYLRPCPTTNYDGYLAADGCTMLGAAPVIYVNPTDFVGYPQTFGEMRNILLHELGHVFDDRYLTDADRERFRRIWHRPAIGWWDELAPVPTGRPVIWDGTIGVMSRAGEWFADAYQVCARATNFDNYLGRWTYAFDAIPSMVDPDPGAAYQFILHDRIVRTCRLIREVWARQPMAH